MDFESQSATALPVSGPRRRPAESARPDSEPGANDTGSHPARPQKPCGWRGLTTVLSHGHGRLTAAAAVTHGSGLRVPEPALTRTFCCKYPNVLLKAEETRAQKCLEDEQAALSQAAVRAVAADPRPRSKFENVMGGDGEQLELSEELTFHGIEYIISLSVSEGPVLVVDVEQVADCLNFFSQNQLIRMSRKMMDNDGTENSVQIISKKLRIKQETSKNSLFSPKC